MSIAESVDAFFFLILCALCIIICMLKGTMEFFIRVGQFM